MGQGKGVGQTKTATNGLNTLGSTATGAAGTAAGIATKNAGIQADANDSATPFAKSLIPGANGSLSPYAQAQYTQAKDNIDKTYQSSAQAQLRGAAARGMGGPTGQTASIANTATQGEGAADTNAYQQAQQNTLGSGLQGVNYLQNQEQIFNPLTALSTEGGLINSGTGAYNGGVAGGKAISSEPSGLQAYGAGIGSLLSNFATPSDG